MISREKCREWAADAGFEISRREITLEDFICTEEVEALINRAYAEGQKDMRERAVRLCRSLERKERDHATGYGPGYLVYTVSDCEVEINKLEIK